MDGIALVARMEHTCLVSLAQEPWVRSSNHLSIEPDDTLRSTCLGQDTLQRIVSQPRPSTASGARKFDDLFGGKERRRRVFVQSICHLESPPKSGLLTDTTDRSKKLVR